MQRPLRNAINSWLNAELAGDSSRAEAALRRVFLRLPLYAPSAGFAARVLARLGISPGALAAPPRVSLRWKVALAACFTLIALAGGGLPRFFATLWTGLGPGKLIDLGAGVLVGFSARLAEGIAIWATLTDVARAVSSTLASPAIVAAIAASALVSAVALRWLHLLLIPERNPRYAQPN